MSFDVDGVGEEDADGNTKAVRDLLQVVSLNFIVINTPVKVCLRHFDVGCEFS
jgi:hypothetical protein